MQVRSAVESGKSLPLLAKQNRQNDANGQVLPLGQRLRGPQDDPNESSVEVTPAGLFGQDLALVVEAIVFVHMLGAIGDDVRAVQRFVLGHIHHRAAHVAAFIAQDARAHGV